MIFSVAHDHFITTVTLLSRLNGQATPYRIEYV